jgi:putative transposase
VHRAFTYRLDPTVKQAQGLKRLMALQCELYNAALEERTMTHEWLRQRLSTKRVPSMFDQFKTFTGLRELRPEFGPFGITVCRGTLTRVEEAFQGYFQRIKAGQKPGYPRFRSASRWDSLSWCGVSGWKLEESSHRLYLQGIGHVKANLHRPLRGSPKTLTVRRRGRHLEATLFCADVAKAELAPTGKSIGIDLGVGVLAATSEGTLHPNPRYRRQFAPGLALAQRKRSLHRRGSHRYRKATAEMARLREKEANRRRDGLYKLSRRLVVENDLIVHEDLKTSNMSRSGKGTVENPGYNVAAKSGLNDAIMDSSWAMLIIMISYKAEEAGRGVAAVNPRYTSQRCSDCGHIAAENRDKEKFACVSCGHSEHADINAARNVLKAGLAQGGNEARLGNAEPVSR